MATRRMFSVDVVTSDAFLNLSHKAQALYYQLLINADDDGLVDNVRSIMRYCGVNIRALNELIAARFVLDLNDNVYAIKHWWINNKKIQSDRYKQTNYPEKLETLAIKGNNAYTFKNPGTKLDPKWNQNGTKLEPQIKLI